MSWADDQEEVREYTDRIATLERELEEARKEYGELEQAASKGIRKLERELADERSKLQSAEASIAGLHDMREKLERESASANRHVSQIQESWRDCIQRKGKAERELAEARADYEESRDVLVKQAEDFAARAEAAESRLAAVAQACDVWYVVVVDDEQVKYVERARVLAALTAPAELSDAARVAENERWAKFDAMVAAPAEPAAVFMVGEGRFAPRTPAAEADGPYFPAHQMMTRIHELEARLAAVAGALNPGTPKFAFQVVADARAALSAPAEIKS